MIDLASLNSVQPQTAQVLQVPWTTLLIVLAGITALMFMVRGMGFLLARRHPVPKTTSLPRPAAPLKEIPKYEPDPQMVAVIAAALSTVFPQPYRITRIEAKKQDYSVEALMNIWSMEGRRQIYDSHRLR